MGKEININELIQLNNSAYNMKLYDENRHRYYISLINTSNIDCFSTEKEVKFDLMDIYDSIKKYEVKLKC